MVESTSANEGREVVRTAIVDAAARLLREHGIGAVTTRGVSQAAGVQAPTIYRLFGDKDGLLDAVAEQVMATYVATKSVDAAREGDRDPLDDLRAGWRLHLDFGLANPDLYALLNDPARLPRSAATAAGIEVLRLRVHRLAAAGRLRVDERRAVEMIHAAGSGAVLTLLATPPDARDLDLADAMFDAVARAIVTDAPATSTSDTTALAVAFATVVAQLPALSPAERALMSEWLERAIVELRNAG